MKSRFANIGELARTFWQCVIATRHKKLTPAVLVLAVLLSGSISINAQDQQTNAAGGTGGTPFTINCPNGKALIGLGGSAFAVGSFLDSVFGQCSSVQPGGARFGNITNTSTASGPGGSSLGNCADNQVVSGIRVYPSVVTAGTLVGGLNVFCQSIGADGRTTGGSSLGPGLTAGAGFSTPVDLHCPNNLPAKGFFGQSGDFIDRIGVVCALPDVSAPDVTSLTLSNNAALGSQAVVATVTLDKPAPASGVDIAFTSNAPTIVTFPSPALHLASASSGTFQVRTNPTATITNVTITATLGASSRSAALQVNPPSVIRINFNPTLVTGGTPTSGQVLLNGPAPENFSVLLTNSNPNVALQNATFNVPVGAGQNSGNFDVNTRAVGSDTNVTMAANTTVSSSFKVQAPRIKSLVLSASQVVAGTSVSGTVNLTGPAPDPSFSSGGGTIGGAVIGPRLSVSSIGLNSNNTAAATVPSGVIANANPTSFNISTSGVSSAQCTQITATFNNSQSVFLGVTPGPSSSNLTFSLAPATVVNLGSSVTGNLSFGGTVFGASLTSSNPNVATVTPASLSAVRLPTGGGNGFTITAVSPGCSMITAKNQNALGQTIQTSIMVIVQVFLSGKAQPLTPLMVQPARSVFLDASNRSPFDVGRNPEALLAPSALR